MEFSLDFKDKVCYTEENTTSEGSSGNAAAQNSQRHGVGGFGPANEVPSLLLLCHPQLLHNGLAGHREKRVMDVLLREGPTLSKDPKRLAGFGSGGLNGFDTVITNLQMQTYVTVHSFEYAHDKYGRPYGWIVVRYAVTGNMLGTDVTQDTYSRDPEKSKSMNLG